MLTRLALVAALGTLTLPALARAQSAPAPAAAVCDGSEIRRLELWRGVGRTLMIATAVADLTAVATVPRNPEGVSKARSHYRFMLATIPVGLAGSAIVGTAYPHEGFWRRTLGRMKVGQTTTAEVRRCLHRPMITTTTGANEQWTYVSAHPLVVGAGSVIRTVRLDFHEGVLTQLSQTEIRRDAVIASGAHAKDGDAYRHHGFCNPPIPVIADPFPTPLDTSAASIAMARAQADADAAMKNASASAAYAACLASDSAW